MSPEIQRELLERSLELNFAWCSLFPSQWRNFINKGWVLCIDRRHPKQTVIYTVPIDHLAKMVWPLAKPKKRKKKA